MTDTYGNEANYTWVKNCIVKAEDINKAVRLIKKSLG